MGCGGTPFWLHAMALHGGLAMRRRKLGRRASRKNFRRGARVKGKNLRSRPMRGGWRL